MRPWIVGLLIVVVAGIALCAGLKDAGRPDDCATSATLMTARLLDDAERVGDRGDCTASQATTDREEAAAHYARADALAATAGVAHSVIPPKADKPTKDDDKVELAKAAAAQADLAELDELVNGLGLDPFRAGRSATLDALIARLPAPMSPDQITSSCLASARMIRRGLLTPASQLIGRASFDDDQEQCETAAAALVAARRSALRTQRAAELLRDKGQDAAARDLDARALRADTSLTASHDVLLAESADDDGWIEDTAEWIGGIPDWLAGAWQIIVVVFVGLTIIGALAYRLVQRMAERRPRFRAWVCPPDGTSWLGRRLVRLQVKVGELGGGKDGDLAGGDASALLEHAINPRGPAAFPFDRVPAAATTDQTVTDIATVLGAVPHGDIAAAVLKLVPSIFPRPTAVVGGRLLPVDDLGAGLVLSIQGPHGDMYDNVLRGCQYDPAPDAAAPVQQGRLIGPGSVWLRHHLSALAGKPPTAEARVKAEMLATAGEQWSAAHDPARAAACYSRALELDPGLLPALHNLAVAEIRLGSYWTAVSRLDDLIGRLLPYPAVYSQWPALLESAEYNLALALSYAA